MSGIPTLLIDAEIVTSSVEATIRAAVKHEEQNRAVRKGASIAQDNRLL